MSVTHLPYGQADDYEFPPHLVYHLLTVGK